MEYPKKRVRLFSLIFFLLISLGCLYYYFFIKLDTNWMFWKKNGENIDWNSIEYDDDFFPTDSTEVYGEYGEWKIKEFKPVYAGYGTTEDGLNYLIGKYLDEDGKEQTVKILVSGEGMADWMFPDSDLEYFYNTYYRENVVIRGEDDFNDTSTVEEEDLEYTAEDNVVGLKDYEKNACPKEVLISPTQLRSVWNLEEAPVDSNYYVETNNMSKYCNLFYMFYTGDDYSSILYPWEYALEQFTVGKQFSVTYLDTEKTFSNCKYNYTGVQQVFCANEYLNEIYTDDFLVAVYIELY